MAAKKKSRKKQSKAKARAGKKKAPVKKRQKVSKAKASVQRKKTKAKPKTSAASKKVAKKVSSARTGKKVGRRSGAAGQKAFPRDRRDQDAGRQSGDSEGLGRVAEADSESADELLEEGNSFEANVVSGVEEAGDKPEREVHTREVPEDDVPQEYLDRD